MSLRGKNIEGEHCLCAVDHSWGELFPMVTLLLGMFIQEDPLTVVAYLIEDSVSCEPK